MHRRRIPSGDITICFRLLDGCSVLQTTTIKRGRLCETLERLAVKARVSLPQGSTPGEAVLEDAAGLGVFGPLIVGSTYYVAGCKRIINEVQEVNTDSRLPPDTRVAWSYDEHMLLHDCGTQRSPETPHRLMRALQTLQSSSRSAELLPTTLQMTGEEHATPSNVEPSNKDTPVQTSITSPPQCAERISSRIATEEEIFAFHARDVYEAFIERGTILDRLPTDVYCNGRASSLAVRYAAAAVIDAGALVLHNTLRARHQLTSTTISNSDTPRIPQPSTYADFMARVRKEAALCALCLVRPPGHHCTATQPAGFCLVNNVAIAVTQLMRGVVQPTSGPRQHPPRVGIVDLDVHFGEGSAEFVDRFDSCVTGEDHPLLYLSLHRYDGGTFYPRDTRAASDFVGLMHKGCIRNVAVDTRASDAEHCEEVISDYLFAEVMEHIFLPSLAAFMPDVVFVSLGLDAAYGDPLGHMAVQGGFAWAAQRLRRWCLAGGENDSRKSPVGLVFVLEGGYNAEAVAQGIVSVAHCLTFPNGDVDVRRYAQLCVPPTWFDLRQRHLQRFGVPHGGMADDNTLLERHLAWCKKVVAEAQTAHKAGLAG